MDAPFNDGAANSAAGVEMGSSGPVALGPMTNNLHFDNANPPATARSINHGGLAELTPASSFRKTASPMFSAIFRC
jgi:hypothetical protein